MNSDKKAFGNNTEKMNTLIRKLCKKSKVIGANIALFNNETILYDYNYGYANKEDNLKSTNESLYMIGSNTKLLTALSIFKLLENGELSLDDDIKNFQTSQQREALEGKDAKIQSIVMMLNQLNLSEEEMAKIENEVQRYDKTNTDDKKLEEKKDER